MGVGGMAWEASPWWEPATALPSGVPAAQTLTASVFLPMAAGSLVLEPHWCSRHADQRSEEIRDESSAAFPNTCRNLPAEPSEPLHTRPVQTPPACPSLRGPRLSEEDGLPWPQASSIAWASAAASQEPQRSHSLLMEMLRLIFKHGAMANGWNQLSPQQRVHSSNKEAGYPSEEPREAYTEQQRQQQNNRVGEMKEKAEAEERAGPLLRSHLAEGVSRRGSHTARRSASRVRHSLPAPVHRSLPRRG